MDFTVDIQGMDEINKTIQRLAKSLKPDDVEPVLLKGAKIIATEAKSRAKRGPTGNLKKAIRTKKLKRLGFGNQPAAVIAAVDRKKAPHAHLVEFGHALVRNGRVIGHVPAYPFWRPAVDAKAGEAMSQVERDLTKLVEEAAK